MTIRYDAMRTLQHPEGECFMQCDVEIGFVLKTETDKRKHTVCAVIG